VIYRYVFFIYLFVLSAPAHTKPVALLPHIACHVSYGGETRIVRAAPTRAPYAVQPVAIGSYFLFRIVFEHPARALPGIKLYTYADRDEGAVPIHIAHFPYPSYTPAHGKRFGFTGEQFVFEPVRDGELHYWCEMEIGRPKASLR
jgi:hypothetical protein